MDSKMQHPPFKRLGLFMHVIGWCIIFGVPFFFTGHEQQEFNVADYMRAIVVPLSMMFVFYMNYYFLVDRFLFSKHGLQFFLANVVLIALAMGMVHLCMTFLPHNPEHQRPPESHWQQIVGF